MVLSFHISLMAGSICRLPDGSTSASISRNPANIHRQSMVIPRPFPERSRLIGRERKGREKIQSLTALALTRPAIFAPSFSEAACKR